MPNTIVVEDRTTMGGDPPAANHQKGGMQEADQRQPTEGSQTPNHPELMQPPAHVLRAAGLLNVDPDDMAYICVVSEKEHEPPAQQSNGLPPVEEDKALDEASQADEFVSKIVHPADREDDISTIGAQSATSPENAYRFFDKLFVNNEAQNKPFRTPYSPPPSPEKFKREASKRSPSSLDGDLTDLDMTETEEASLESAMIVEVSLPSRVPFLDEESVANGASGPRQCSDFDSRYYNEILVTSSQNGSGLVLDLKEQSGDYDAAASEVRRIESLFDLVLNDERDIQAMISSPTSSITRGNQIEKQSQQTEDSITGDLDEIKRRIESISKRMEHIRGVYVSMQDTDQQDLLHNEYMSLEIEMDRYSTALFENEQWKREQHRMEESWEKDCEAENNQALQNVRRHMPVEVRRLSVTELTSRKTPFGKFLPKAIAKKFKRSNVLQTLRMHPESVASMLPTELENLRVSGLTLTERRALHAHLKQVDGIWSYKEQDKDTKQQRQWYLSMKNKFRETLEAYNRHTLMYGITCASHSCESSVYVHRCPLIGKQCPVIADQSTDYSDDYGFPAGDIFEEKSASNETPETSGETKERSQEKKSKKRATAIKKHYKGNILKTSQACGICDALDALLNAMRKQLSRWSRERDQEVDTAALLGEFNASLTELKMNSAELSRRAGGQSRKKHSPDTRSAIEIHLTNDFFNQLKESIVFMKDWMFELGVADRKLSSTTRKLVKIWAELMERNNETLTAMGDPAAKSKAETTSQLNSIHSRASSLGAQSAEPSKSGSSVDRAVPIDSLSLVAAYEAGDATVATGTVLEKTPLQGLLQLSGRSRHGLRNDLRRSESLNSDAMKLARSNSEKLLSKHSRGSSSRQVDSERTGHLSNSFVL